MRRSARRARCAELDPVWLEEPTIPDDVPGHARIVREGGLPIAAGENLHTLYEFRQLIAAGGVTFPEPDVTNCGGVTVVHEGRPPRRGVQPAGHLARRARPHRAPARRGAEPLVPRGPRLRARPLHRRAAAIEDGSPIAPERPGHGIAFDWKALEAVRA